MKQEHIGLSDTGVLLSRAKHGDNSLTPPPQISLWQSFLEKFKDPIVIILLLALAMSVGVATYQYTSGSEGAHIFLEPLGIFAAVLLSTLIGFIFETKANSRFNILTQANEAQQAKVIRQGVVHTIPRSDIVVGDVIVVESGDEVPADALLLESTALSVNESSLTGEISTRKSCNESLFDSDATYPTNLILRGSTIIEGHALAQVITVGDNTEYGKVYRTSQIDSSVKTPLNRQLERLASLITKFSYVVASMIVVGRIVLFLNTNPTFEWITFASYMLSTIMLAVTLVVVSVPEGLPMSVTLSLALSMQRMLKANNLVRKMHACESMGATTVICTDKTGTLTENRMRVHEAQFFGNNENPLTEASIAINSTAHLEKRDNSPSSIIGNPTEGALLLWLEEQSKDYTHLRNSATIVEQLPFSTERKYMATVANTSTEGKRIVYVKGAPEVIIARSNNILINNRHESIEVYLKGVTDDLRHYQNMAMRTLAFAYAEISEDVAPFENDNLADIPFTLLGVVAISDPLRAEVPAAIKECRAAGIEVKIVTGDTPATAKQIAREVGIWSDACTDANHITGTEFEALSDEELMGRISSLKIISRARPMDKQRLVRLLQQRGEVVAVTGDGTNDAPALKAAQIGLSMGDGTSVAKQASDITILDNSFSTIASAVMWGRSLYQNIQRFILFQLTINIVACFVVLVCALSGGESPLTVTQMLWINLIMDTFAALALASLPPSHCVMKEAPRSHSAHIITRSMARRIIGIGLAFTMLLLSLVRYFKVTDITSLTEFNFAEYCSAIFNFTASPTHSVSPYEGSLLFTIFVMLQFWNMFNARAFLSGRSALHKLARCRGFLLSMLIILVGQWLITTFGGAMFNTVPLKPIDWLIITASTSTVLLAGELSRLVARRQ